ncbi:MAG: hypothetical protein O3A47_00025 [Chloroflexi bacterium]|nr:hypothetical protein [Chloroflexota bacterium]
MTKRDIVNPGDQRPDGLFFKGRCFAGDLQCHVVGLDQLVLRLNDRRSASLPVAGPFARLDHGCQDDLRVQVAAQAADKR